MNSPHQTSAHPGLATRGFVPRAGMGAALVALLAGCGSSSSTPPPTQPSSAPTPASSTPSPASRRSVPRTMVHTRLTGTGRWTTTTLAVKPTHRTADLHRYTVQAEGGTDIDVDQAARQISAILNDPRSWIGQQGTSFELVAGTATADLVIHLASPGTATRMCRPLDVAMTLSCSKDDKVILNTDRWLYAVPAYTDLDQYRAYLVNHEVGHFIGKGHVGCPGTGRKAPVMMQQTKGVGACLPNPWPVDDGK